MANYLLQPARRITHDGDAPPSRNPLVRFQRGFEAGFERFRAGYRDLLALALMHRAVFVVGFLGFVARVVPAGAVSRPQFLSRRSTPARS